MPYITRYEDDGRLEIQTTPDGREEEVRLSFHFRVNLWTATRVGALDHLRQYLLGIADDVQDTLSRWDREVS